MRRRNQARVLGPYQERGRWRLIIVEDGGRRSVFFPTHEEARKFKAGAEREISQPPSRRLADVLAEWHTQKRQSGQCKPETADNTYRRLRFFFTSVADEDIAALTPRRAAVLYLDATKRVSLKTGTVPAAASHRGELSAAKSFYLWAMQRGYVSVSPFRGVVAVGKVKTGKPQLRIEEARRFTSAAVAYFEETEHPLAIGVLLALTMGLRTSEVTQRVARDLDDGGRCIWIDAGKTAQARRRLDVPELVQPYLNRLAAGKGSDDLLFGMSRQGKPRCRQKMWEMVRRLCQRAGVPSVCTHSLRGLWATLAVQSGAASHAVAANLGHHSFEMTKRHYAQGAAVTNAATARVLETLSCERPVQRRSAREQLEQLDEGELTLLLELLAEAKKGRAPTN